MEKNFVKVFRKIDFFKHAKNSNFVIEGGLFAHEVEEVGDGEGEGRGRGIFLPFLDCHQSVSKQAPVLPKAILLWYFCPFFRMLDYPSEKLDALSEKHEDYFSLDARNIQNLPYYKIFDFTIVASVSKIH